MRHIISILVENKFGVLARIAGMFSGRGFNIETLNVGPMPDSNFSRITATIIGDSSALDQSMMKQPRHTALRFHLSTGLSGLRAEDVAFMVVVPRTGLSEGWSLGAAG